MTQFPMHRKVRVLLPALLILGVLPTVVIAENIDESLSFLAENPVIHPGVISALEQEAAAAVVVTLDLPPIENSRYAHHPAAKTDVHPLLFDLVASAEPGTVRFEEAGPSFALQARMSVAALRALDDNPDILAIEIDPNPVILDDTASSELPASIPSKVHCPCSPRTGSTVACLAGNRWKVSVKHGGTSSKVAKYSSQSAVFWTFNSSNWEILAKVIDGCAVNGRWWVFAAGASSVSYSLKVTDADFCPRTTTYSSASYGNPILDTNAFPCP